MAMYKPVFCTPYMKAGNLNEITKNNPFVLSCKVNSSNTPVVGYSVRLYDENLNQIFPVDREDKITLLSESERVKNGEYIEVPFIKYESGAGAPVFKDKEIENIIVKKKGDAQSQSYDYWYCTGIKDNITTWERLVYNFQKTILGGQLSNYNPSSGRKITWKSVGGVSKNLWEVEITKEDYESVSIGQYVYIKSYNSDTILSKNNKIVEKKSSGDELYYITVSSERIPFLNPEENLFYGNMSNFITVHDATGFIKGPIKIQCLDTSIIDTQILEIDYKKNLIQIKSDSSKISYGCIIFRSGNLPKLSNGKEYYWSITLYQSDIDSLSDKINAEDVVSAKVSAKQFLESSDLTIASGKVLGSNNIRIQSTNTKEQVLDCFLQPVFISNLQYEVGKEQGWTIGTEGTISEVGNRVKIKNYVSPYGYYYLTTGENGIDASVITKDNANGFRVYKNTNDVNLMAATRRVTYLLDQKLQTDTKNNVTVEWKESAVNASQSYWNEQYYTNNASGIYKPFAHLGIMNIFESGTRIIFNAQGDASFDGASPFNGIFTPQYSTTETSGSSYISEVKYDKSVVKKEGEEYYIDAVLSISDEEKLKSAEVDKAWFEIGETGVVTPITITSVSTNVESATTARAKIFINKVPGLDNTGGITVVWKVATYIYKVEVNWLRTTDANTWGTLYNKVVFVNGNNYEALGIGEENVSTAGVLNQTSIKFQIEKPIELFPELVNDQNKYRNTIGLIFYNTFSSTNGEDNVLYISPFEGIKPKMLWYETSNFSNRFFMISDINTQYYYIKYKNVFNTGVNVLPRPQYFQTDVTEYDIKTSFMGSNLNPFSFQDSPSVTISCATKNLGTIIHCSATFKQNNFLHWRSYYWEMYKASSGELVYSGSTKYDKDISEDFPNIGYIVDGTNSNTYIFKIVFLSTDGNYYQFSNQVDITVAESTTDLTANPKYTEYVQFTKDCDKMSNNISFRKESHNVIVFKEEVGISLYKLYEHNDKVETIIDYSVGNKRNYNYYIFWTIPDTSTNYRISFKNIRHNFDSWSIVDIDSETGEFLSEWKLRYGLNGGGVTQNISKNKIDNMSRYSSFSHGTTNHLSGSVTCYLGRDIIMSDNSYEWYAEKLPDDSQFKDLSSNEEIAMIEAWKYVCASPGDKLIRDIKGNMYLAQITESSITTKEEWEKMPTEIQFGWCETPYGVDEYDNFVMIKNINGITYIPKVIRVTSNK